MNVSYTWVIERHFHFGEFQQTEKERASASNTTQVEQRRRCCYAPPRFLGCKHNTAMQDAFTATRSTRSKKDAGRLWLHDTVLKFKHENFTFVPLTKCGGFLCGFPLSKEKQDEYFRVTGLPPG